MTMRVKPCPFCGEQPTVKPDDPSVEGDAWGEVSCENSECPVIVRVEDGETVSDERGSDEYKRAAIRRWNKRVSS